MIASRVSEILRCPDCGQTLALVNANTLRCAGGDHTFPVRDGVARFATDATAMAQYFGYMWSAPAAVAVLPEHVSPYHVHAMCEALDVPSLEGLILDVGCGEGVDLSQLALDPKCEVIRVELSSGGVATTLARIRGLSRAHVIQGDLMRQGAADLAVMAGLETLRVAQQRGWMVYARTPA